LPTKSTDSFGRVGVNTWPLTKRKTTPKCGSRIPKTNTKMTETTVPVHLVTFDNPSNIEYNDADNTIENHDELEKTDVVRGMPKSEVREYNLDIVTKDSPLWRDGFEDISVGDEYPKD